MQLSCTGSGSREKREAAHGAGAAGGLLPPRADVTCWYFWPLDLHIDGKKGDDISPVSTEPLASAAYATATLGTVLPSYTCD